MRIYLIGICGTGMGSLAGLLAEAGHDVSGSDQNVFPPISTMLARRGIRVREGYRPTNLLDDGRPDLIVVGNVVGRSNPEVEAMLAGGFEHVSMPEAIARFFLGSRHSIVVSGTHGKTTTSGIIARTLLDTGLDPSFLVGGVLQGLDSSYRLGAEGRPFVVEGDEYETSFADKGPKFLHYAPRTVVLTSVEYDHAEMYESFDAVRHAFSRLIALIPPANEGGRLVVCADDPVAMELSAGCRGEVVPYGVGGTGAARIEGVVVESGPEGTSFRVRADGGDLGVFRIRLTGDHNLRNGLAALAVARGLGVPVEDARRGLLAFEGVRRRQEIRGEAGGVTVIDDFAHHPTAVRETIAGTRSRFPKRRLWAIFEPRTNTTRRDVFQQRYAEAFDGADRVVIAPVDHPERAPEGHRFDVSRLVADLGARDLDARTLADVPAIVAAVAAEASAGDVVLIMSNGGFGGIHERLLEALKARVNAGNPGQSPA